MDSLAKLGYFKRWFGKGIYPFRYAGDGKDTFGTDVGGVDYSDINKKDGLKIGMNDYAIDVKNFP